MSTTPRLSHLLRPPRLGPPSSELTDRQRELLDALEALIIDEGFASLGVGEIAARLKCSRSTLYDLAPSKDELVLMVVDRRLRRIGRIKQERLGQIDDYADKIKMVIAGKFLELRETGLRFMEDVAKAPAVQRLIADHFRYGVLQLREVIEDGIEAGRFRPLHSLVVAEVIDAALERIQRPELLRDLGMTWDDATVELMSFLCAGLVLDAPVPSSPTRRRTRRAEL